VIFLENEISMAARSRCQARGFHRADRQGEGRARRQDVTLVSFGIGMAYALAAAEKLRQGRHRAPR
jgi:pyruvate/2-oxoglutarate/acetoin dehydrogenase E1 component